MMQVNLEPHEWDMVLDAMSYAPMRQAMNLYMSIKRQTAMRQDPIETIKRQNSGGRHERSSPGPDAA